MKLDYRSVIVVTGPSGVGKGTLIRNLRKQIPELSYSISATTRPRRPEEQDGREYFFITSEEFEQRVANGEFIEHAEYSGYRYGTLQKEVDRRLEAGNPVILEIELDGARQVRRNLPEALQIFIAPPSFTALQERLAKRGTDTADQVSKRLQIAQAELKAQGEFDVQVVNDRLEAAVEELGRIVRIRLQAARTERQPD